MITRDHETGVLVTIGPTLETAEHIEMAIKAGASNFRLHFGHRDRDHASDAERIRAVARSLAAPITLLADLPSSRPRIGPMRSRRLSLGDRLRFVDADGAPSVEAVPLPGIGALAEQLEPGAEILFADGRITLVVEDATGGEVRAVVVRVAVPEIELKAAFAIQVPGGRIRYQRVTEMDLGALDSCRARGAFPDWIALSFVEGQTEIDAAREVLMARFPGASFRVMAKVETRRGVEHAAEIAESADGLLVGRGDLLSDLDPEELPEAQETIIEAAHAYSRTSVVATQLLEQFSESGDLSRAEITDVHHAVRQRPTALMLSKESCFGPRPIACIKLLSRFIARVVPTSVGLDRVLRAAGRCPDSAPRPYRVLGIEGPNGVGKSELCRRLSNHLNAQFRLGVPDIFMSRELKHRMIFEADWRASTLFFLAGGIELNRELRSSKPTGLLILDRSPWSTLAVQSATDPRRTEWVARAMEIAAKSLPWPDHLLVLEASFETCRARIATKAPEESSFDRDSEVYFAREAEMYQKLAAAHPSAVLIATDGLDASDVLARTVAAIDEFLGDSP